MNVKLYARQIKRETMKSVNARLAVLFCVVANSAHLIVFEKKIYIRIVKCVD